jgi:flavin reductase (DIM6/NTAB) family NADH-FMN oxidoreductase RutF
MVEVAVQGQELRQALSRFATGVTVVTVKGNGRLHGMTANAFCSVSLDPPLVLVSIDHKARSYGLLSQAGRYVINVLAESQAAVADRFAGRGPGSQDDFAGLAVWSGKTGVPVLADALAALECQLERVIDIADHGLFVGRVVALHLGSAAARPLLYYRRRYRRLDPAD